jgi:hypothetical protein
MRIQQLVSLSLMCALLAGCFGGGGPERPKTYPVTGTVTFKGQPLEDAQVTLVPTGTGPQAATGVTDAAGKFAIGTFEAKDGAMEGEYGVKVVKYNIKVPQGGGNVQLTHEQEQAQYKEDDLKPAEPLKNILPGKYENHTTSGLKHTVTKGATTLDIVLEE